MEQLYYISEEELDIWVKMYVDKGITDLETMMKELLLIDRQLTVIRSRSLLTRRSPNVRKQLEMLIHCHITGDRPFWDARRSKYVYNPAQAEIN